VQLPLPGVCRAVKSQLQSILSAGVESLRDQLQQLK
jgi:hypothetical protein